MSAPPEPTGDDTGAPEPAGEDATGPPPSGLRNPAAAVRGMGAATLALEALLLLLALQPIRTIAPDTSGWAIGVVAALAVCCGALAGLMGKRWAWKAGTVLQIALVLTGILQWALFVLGGLFLAIWIYELRVRRTVLGRANG